jgi:hypothetical protein
MQLEVCAIVTIQLCSGEKHEYVPWRSQKKESNVLIVLLRQYIYLLIGNFVLVVLLYFISTWFIWKAVCKAK